MKTVVSLKIKRKYLFAVVAVVLSAILIGVVIFFVSNQPTVNHDEFAKCLTQKNATMYGAYWCPHCQNEKNAFGNSWKYVNYVECDPAGANANPQLCQERRIAGYPTWIIGGRTYEGEFTLENLAKLTGCSLV